MFGLLSHLPVVHKLSRCRHSRAVCSSKVNYDYNTGMSSWRWQGFSASHREVMRSVCFNDFRCLNFYCIQLDFFFYSLWLKFRGKMNLKVFKSVRCATACQSPCQKFPLCTSCSSAWSKFNWLQMRSIITDLSLQPLFICFTSWNEQSLGLFLT